MRINLARTVKVGSIAMAGAVAFGLLAFPTTYAANGEGKAVKRDEDSGDVVLVTDDEDDDTDTDGTGATETGDTGTTGASGNTTAGDDTAGTETGTGTGTGTNTGGTDTGTETDSGDQNDPTNSRVTDVSEDRDLSRGDLTRDWTKDGKGGKKLDLTADHTNDASRNDTRG